jgi:hypothetical protein
MMVSGSEVAFGYWFSLIGYVCLCCFVLRSWYRVIGDGYGLGLGKEDGRGVI